MHLHQRKPMKTTTQLSTLVALSILLVGCDDSPTQEEEENYIQQVALQDLGVQDQADKQDLQKTLEEMHAKDPRVKDVYYGIDEQGNKELHVVRYEDENSSQVSESVWPMNNFLSGYLMAQFFNNNGGYNSYASMHQPARRFNYDDSEERNRRNATTSAYYGSLVTRSRARTVSNPSYRNNLKTAVEAVRVQSRASGIFTGGDGGGGTRAAARGAVGG